MPYILPVCILLFIFFPLSTVRSYPSISRYCRNGNGANSCFDFVILALDLTFSDVLQDCKAWTYDFKANARNIKQFFTVGINSNDSEPRVVDEEGARKFFSKTDPVMTYTEVPEHTA